MYKTYLTVGLIALLFGIGVFWHSQYLEKSTNSLVSKLVRVEKFVQSDRWEDAKLEIKQVDEEWKATKKWWSILLHHQEIDNIDISLKRVEKYIEGKNAILGLGELSALQLLVEHIADTEAISLQNIL